MAARRPKVIRPGERKAGPRIFDLGGIQYLATPCPSLVLRSENTFTVEPPFRAAHAGLKPGAWSFYIGRALYLRIPLPSPSWGRGWIASGAFTSRCETGEGVHARASYPDASGNDHTASKIFCTNLVLRSKHHAAGSVSVGVWRSSSAFWICAPPQARERVVR